MRSLEVPSGGAWAPSRGATVVVSVADTTANYGKTRCCHGTLACVPTRRTKRGSKRTPLKRDCDVLVCGASFAGLAVARELAGSGARVLIVDRYDVGERQTSACAAPTEWLEAMGVGSSIRQTFGELVIHTPHVTARMRLPWTFSTFDYPSLSGLLLAQCEAEFETAKVDGRTDTPVHTDR